jgi:hypothetical protein
VYGSRGLVIGERGWPLSLRNEADPDGAFCIGVDCAGYPSAPGRSVWPCALGDDIAPVGLLERINAGEQVKGIGPLLVCSGEKKNDEVSFLVVLGEPF